MGGAITTGLAGCGEAPEGTESPENGDDQNGNVGGNLGERVPTLSFGYFTGHRTTERAEKMAPLLQEYWGELGVTFEASPGSVSAIVSENWGDKRTNQVYLWAWGPSPTFLDPQVFIRRHMITNAGGDGNPNTVNWANCKYTELAYKQARTADPDKRQELINQALELASEEVWVLPDAPTVVNSTWRSDQFDLQTGNLGGSTINSELYNRAKATGGRDTLITNIQPVQIGRANFYFNTFTSQPVWQSVLNSKLMVWDRNAELKYVLAEDHTLSDDGTTYEFTLRDNIQYHNGDPIDADAVAWVYNTLFENADGFTYVRNPGVQSVEAVDDRTVRFNLDSASPVFIPNYIARWGVVHPGTWEGLGEDPEGFTPDMDNFVGSGPYQLRDFEASSHLSLEPTGNHPVYDPDPNLFFQAFQDTQTAVEQLIGGEIQLIVDLPAGSIERVENSNISDSLTVDSTPTFTYEPIVQPQMQFSATKFREFRDALGKAMNRQEMNQVGRRGLSKPEYASCIIPENHPFRPPEDRLYAPTTEPTGDVDAARQVLEDNGWGWDNNGRLHYPADADLSPVWPKGEEPTSEDGFDCVDSEGKLNASWAE